jgi:hypothetical protein
MGALKVSWDPVLPPKAFCVAGATGTIPQPVIPPLGFAESVIATV